VYAPTARNAAYAEPVGVCQQRNNHEKNKKERDHLDFDELCLPPSMILRVVFVVVAARQESCGHKANSVSVLGVMFYVLGFVSAIQALPI
jgi:hypothetical protein